MFPSLGPIALLGQFVKGIFPFHFTDARPLKTGNEEISSLKLRQVASISFFLRFIWDWRCRGR